jgi:hypothetical protein
LRAELAAAAGIASRELLYTDSIIILDIYGRGESKPEKG